MVEANLHMLFAYNSPAFMITAHSNGMSTVTYKRRRFSHFAVFGLSHFYDNEY